MLQKRIIPAACALLLLSCSTQNLTPREEPEGWAFRLRLDVPAVIQTRSTISGQEGVHGMQMLCFDEFGMYLGLGAVSIAPADQSGGFAGTLTGSVPAATAAIHFIANAGLVPQPGWRDLPEAELVGSLTASAANTHIVYWGYHRADTPAQMYDYLTAEPANTVRLLRDRAKVTLSEADPDWDHNPLTTVTERITAVRFAVCNGLDTGMLAPFDRTSLAFSYTAPLTLPANRSRYGGTAAELTAPGEAQFLFEDENTLENPVKVILETSYEITSGGTTTQKVKYHQVMLMHDDYSLYRIQRNHQYNIIIGNLPSAIAYDSFEEALAGGPSNNQTVYVQEIVPQVMTGSYSLDIPGGTTRIFQREQDAPQTGVIDFTFFKDGVADPDITAENFSATWLSNKYVAYPNATLQIVQGDAPGHFRLQIQLYHPITDDLKSGKILLIDQTSGLARYLNIYSITAFDFSALLVPTGIPSDPFRLQFTIPENFPAALFPFSVRIASDDFKPTTTQNADKALGVIVAPTQTLIGEDWDYWYTYEVSGPGTYNVLLTPVDGRTGMLRAYLNAEFFGDLDSEGNKIGDAILLEASNP